MASKILEGKATEARELVARAEKKLGTSKFMSMFSGNKYEDAAERPDFAVVLDALERCAKEEGIDLF